MDAVSAGLAAPTVYRTQDLALRRVEALQAVGIWPGILRCPGGWRLTYDPPVPVGDLDSHGYAKAGEPA
jgi:hypothetical protein